MKKIKNILSLLLAAAMILSLAACGKNSEIKTEETPTPEYVYTSEYKTLQEGERGLNAVLFTQDGFYSLDHEKIGDKEHESPA